MLNPANGQGTPAQSSLLGDDAGPHDGPYKIPVATTFPPNPAQTAPQAQGTPQTAQAGSTPKEAAPFNFTAWLRSLSTMCGRQAERFKDLGEEYSGWAAAAESVGVELVQFGMHARHLAERIDAIKFPAVPPPPPVGV